MEVVTMDSIPGKKVVRVLGMVSGNSIRTKHVGKDIMAGLKTIAGGELSQYTEMMIEARQQALQRMMKQAEEMGANAILCVRYMSSSVMRSAAEMVAYGTAVVIE